MIQPISPAYNTKDYASLMPDKEVKLNTRTRKRGDKTFENMLREQMNQLKLKEKTK